MIQLNFIEVKERYVRLLEICNKNKIPAHFEQLIIINLITSHGLLGDITEEESAGLVMDYLKDRKKEPF